MAQTYDPVKKRQYHNRLRREFIAAHHKPCLDCGRLYPFYNMEFDHIPGRGAKSFDVGRRVDCYKYNNSRLLAEIAKCDLVCALCHSTRTHRRRCLNQECGCREEEVST